ncbi:hypothetical protein QN277_005793 [Acacia crassicarpa]|uniref:F-box domain-containing protein n=1 Tax=Acacia crassicarpa TaxID=499986 RepID=A0AAE1MBY1_9FABA|nr:hypothetical protein QN277_005793 [Acacia crassicarpa]
MEETKINGAAPYLPEEVITNILMRLPVKPLMRFRCVCKNWENLYKTPFFIAAHLRHSQQNPFLMFSHDYLCNDLPLRLLDCDMQLRDVQKAPLFHSLLSYFIGSCNGLLCFITMRYCNFPSSFLLWNPATRHSIEVPVSRTINYHVHHMEIGFGFSTLVNDYKILVIYALYSDRMVCGVDVYSLNKGSWKEIAVGNLFDISFVSPAVSCNGAIFTSGLKLGKKVIVSFDIATEVFTFIPWPPLLDHPTFSKFTVYDGKFALLTTNLIGTPSKVDLWVIEEDMSSSEDRWNWIKKFTSDPYPCEFIPWTIWRNKVVVSRTEIGGEIRKNKECLCLFNITTNEFKILDIHGNSLQNFVNYTESLVPVVNATSNEFKSLIIPQHSIGDIAKAF